MHNYKNLKIWHEAMDLVTEIYTITVDFPDYERFGLTSQIRRAVSSIPTNIAEGTSRISQREFRHFLSIALGSSFEVSTQIEIAYRLKMISEEKRNELLTMNDLLQRKIQSFSKQLR
jgi:four helix bundle protein